MLLCRVRPFLQLNVAYVDSIYRYQMLFFFVDTICLVCLVLNESKKRPSFLFLDFGINRTASETNELKIY